MKFVLHPCSQAIDANCRPVTIHRGLPEVPIGNRPWLEVQTSRLVSAGFVPSARDDVDQTALTLHVSGEAWLSDEMLQTMLTASEPARFVDDQGTMLASITRGKPPSDSEPSTTVDAASFAVRYAWDILRVHERVVGSIKEARMEGDVSPGVVVDGLLEVGEGTRVLPGVYIEGNVLIGRNCKIGPNCYIRGNTSIGDRCHIGQAVELKNSILFAGTSIGHLSYCGDSIIGENVNFGAGTITANLRHDGRSQRSEDPTTRALVDTGRRKLGVIVGDGVHTGIHTSIYPGRKMWPHTSTRPGGIVDMDIVEA